MASSHSLSARPSLCPSGLTAISTSKTHRRPEHFLESRLLNVSPFRKPRKSGLGTSDPKLSQGPLPSPGLPRDSCQGERGRAVRPQIRSPPSAPRGGWVGSSLLCFTSGKKARGQGTEECSCLWVQQTWMILFSKIKGEVIL